MNNCVELTELISAYADGELTQSDCRRVEEHLSSCESCSAILELYREISTAMDESVVPAPEALCDGVMNMVFSEETPAVTDTAPTAGNADRRRLARVMLLRYAPLAACLAIVLLAMPWIINSLRHTPYDQASPELATQFSMYADMNDGGKTLMTDDLSAGSEGIRTAASDDSMAVLPASPEDTQMPVRRSYDEDAAVDNAGTDQRVAAEPPPAEMSAFEPAPTLSPAPLPEPGAAPDAVPNAVFGGDPDSAPGLEATMATAVESEEALWDQDADDSFDSPMGNQVQGDVRDLSDNFSDAYAWIEITGELPELLKKYEPEPFDGWSGPEVYYIIQRADALELIRDIRNRSDASVTYNYEHGGYALVLYSSGE